MIHIDATQFLNGLQVLSQEHLQAVTDVLVGVAEAARLEISTIAQQKLSKKSAEEYILGLKEPLEVQPGSVTLTLTGKLPNMLESGFASFDMKPALLKNAQSGKMSRYVDVPFEHSKDKGGADGLQPLSEDAARSLGSAVKKAKQALKGTGGVTSARGGKFSPEQSQVASKYTWKTSKDSDVKQTIKVRPGGGIASQSNPTTFRRISEEASEPNAWIHPGVKPADAVQAFKAVEKRIHEMLDTAIKPALEKLT